MPLHTSISNCLRQTHHRARGDRPIARFIPSVIGLICRSLGSRFGTLRGHFGVDFGVIFVVLGGVLATTGSRGLPKGGRVGKVTEKVVRGPFVGPPPGPLGSPNRQQIEKKSFREARWKTLCARCCPRGVSGPPPTMKIMVLHTRNH